TGVPIVVLYAFDLLMLRGHDVRLWPLEDCRHQLRELVSTLPDVIRYSETFNVPLAELERAVREHRLEGIVAKRAGSPYRSRERNDAWLKWRVNRGQEFVTGGYVPNGDTVESILVGYYEGRQLIYAPAFAPDCPPSCAVCCCHSSQNCRSPAAHSSICQIAAKGGGVKDSQRPRWLPVDSSTHSWSRASSSWNGR
ncbi:MAG TPA: hypothetical protein VJ728_03690, partial [Candidatus Binataceae bacterium]|nr:hypothetical protein [Candidatus Binataceae bacterium]